MSSTADWAKNALSGDLGRSLFTDEAVSELIGQRIGVTIQLAFMSILLAVLIAIPLGIARRGAR